MKFMSQGAEARLYDSEKGVLKHRVKKNYRHDHIDDQLRKQRTRREAKILEKLTETKFPAPSLVESDGQEKILMEKIDGPRLRDVLEDKDSIALAKEVGKKVAMLHNLGIIHGDLTTSNMIFADEIHFIDFGLSFFSDKPENRAVDLHLLKQALESKHYKVWEECFAEVLRSYSEEADFGKEVIERLEIVESRGRNKGKH